MKVNKFEHLTDRQQAACYFIMKILGVYVKDSETPEEFLSKYLEQAKIKAGWENPKARAKHYSLPIFSLDEINESGVEIEEDLRSELMEYHGYIG